MFGNQLKSPCFVLETAKPGPFDIEIERQLLGIAGTGGLTTIELFANWYETTAEEETDSSWYKTVELSYHCGRQKWVT